MSNGSKELVGKSGKFTEIDFSTVVGSFCSIFRPNNEISGQIVEHLFASVTYRQVIKRILTGSTINNLKPSDIEEISISVTQGNINFKNLLKKLTIVKYLMKQVESITQSSKAQQKSIINEVF